MSDRTLLSMAQGDYERRLASIANGLRRLADEIEREGRVRDGPEFGGTPRFGWAAHKALHALVWGTANLHADTLCDAAARADHAELAAERGSSPEAKLKEGSGGSG